MKRRSFRRHNSLVAAYPWAGPAALALFALVAVFALLRAFLPGALVAVASPFWTAGGTLSAAVGNTSAVFANGPKLQAELDTLRADYAALSAANAATEARAQDLARLLGTRTEPARGVLAGVLARPPVSPYDALVVDQGSDAGVRVGMRAEGPGGMPLGMVESVTAASARIVLYSAPGAATESWVGEERIPVTVHGEGAGAMSAVVAREAGLVPGDLVYVAAGGAAPIGTIISVTNDPTLPRARAEIRPLSNPFSVTWVTLVP